ncbi:uncharacterized protein K444DRAFT_277250 [Hyaloscypha bicolor E]|uniref:Uncharacterized protein n=1 Tax=Hyaloscypha bicolor E TaxID=1095630 RepID=A0A2J6SJ76_9HELO|nr:uncharacterized protein K444DRAFT_277250 [Hyaloscypha bicolor E]PMD50823.1 hypothetical protein K444DRAFT_277250 [Hyaloscypha bicolor E]
MILLSSLRSNNIRDLLELNPIMVIIQHNQQRLTALINRTPSHHGSLLQERSITSLYLATRKVVAQIKRRFPLGVFSLRRRSTAKAVVQGRV